jgi:hypothetical protein
MQVLIRKSRPWKMILDLPARLFPRCRRIVIRIEIGRALPICQCRGIVRKIQHFNVRRATLA